MNLGSCYICYNLSTVFHIVIGNLGGLAVLPTYVQVGFLLRNGELEFGNGFRETEFGHLVSVNVFGQWTSTM